MTQSDTVLIGRVAGRDGKAFEALFERHRRSVRRRLVRMLRDEPTADDLVQEVFLRVWTRAETWEARGSVRGWLMRIATNLAINHMRSAPVRRRRHLEVPADPDEDEGNAAPGWMIDAAALGPDEVLQRAERDERLRGMVSELSEEKREVLDMIYGNGMPIASAAEALGIPAGTVKSRLHYALKKLSRKYGNIERTEEDR